MFAVFAVSPFQIDSQVTLGTLYDVDVISDMFFEKSFGNEALPTITASKFVDLHLSFKMIFESGTT